MNILDRKTLADVRAHATARYPEESCGLVVVERGKPKYIACSNVSERPMEDFAISALDFANAEERGEIVCIVHSHPNAPCRPSMADKVSCESHRKPFLIVEVGADGAGDMSWNEPSGYQAPLIGRPFVHGVLDCYSLVQDWYVRERDIILPDFERQELWWTKGDDLYMQHYEDAGFSPIRGKMQIGDVILMQLQSKVVNHGAVYIGDSQIIQHIYNRLSSRDLYDGYFQEITRVVIRHKDMPQ